MQISSFVRIWFAFLVTKIRIYFETSKPRAAPRCKFCIFDMLGDEMTLNKSPRQNNIGS